MSKKYDDKISDKLTLQVKDLEKKNIHLNSIRVEMYYSLTQEMLDLKSRLLKLEQRIKALGFSLPYREVN